MPANIKYLTKSPWQKFAKITSGIIGGYIITALLHMCATLCFPYPREVLVTAVFTYFIIWCTLLIVPFLFYNGWKAWVLYVIISIVLYGIYLIVNQNNPFI